MNRTNQWGLFIVLSLAPLHALADQCAYVTEQQAQDAAKLVRIGDKVTQYCEPCGDGSKVTETVSSVGYASVNYMQFFGLTINGKPVDLAYTYLRTSTAVDANMAYLVGCPASGVSMFLKVTH